MSIEVDLEEILKIPSCTGDFQKGNSYCAMGKLYMVISGERNLRYTLVEEGVREYFPKVTEAMRKVSISSIPKEDIMKVIALNDTHDKHEEAVKLVFEAAQKAGLLKIKTKQLVGV